jgi:hypothetical protein
MRVVLKKRVAERDRAGERIWEEGYALVKTLKQFGVEAESELMRTMDTEEAEVTVTFELPDPDDAILLCVDHTTPS